MFWSLGATRTADAKELLYARQKVVVTTKAFGLQAIDLVYIDYKDVEGLRRQAREGALMGFTGKVPVPFVTLMCPCTQNVFDFYGCSFLVFDVSFNPPCGTET